MVTLLANHQMFRKVAHIILSLFLMVATIGVTFSMHYCGGDLVSTSINQQSNTCCNDTGGCCENKTVHVEVEADYLNPGLLKNVEVMELDLLLPIVFIFQKTLVENKIDKPFYAYVKPPPKIRTVLSQLQTYLL